MTPSPAPVTSHESRLDTFLRILLHLAPTIVAPFIKSTGAVALEGTIVPVVEAAGDSLLPPVVPSGQ